jgi:hypothetical protein
MVNLFYIIGLTGAAIAFLTASFFKHNSISTDQKDTKDALDKADVNLKGNREDLKAEETLREEAKAEAKKEQNEKVSTDNVVDFFNNRK